MQPKSREIERLVRGYEKFRAKYFNDPQNDLYKTLVKQGQKPKTMVVACSDSRVDPSILLNSAPGQLFIVRNVANLVPPWDPEVSHDGAKTLHYHGTSAALEFAVRDLKVENLVLLGHSHCGGIRALLKTDNQSKASRAKDFITRWMNIAEAARKKVFTACKKQSLEKQARRCEEEALIVSLKNLLTFPWIAEKVDAGKLQLHAWHFDLSTGILQGFNPRSNKFEDLKHGARTRNSPSLRAQRGNP